MEKEKNNDIVRVLWPLRLSSETEMLGHDLRTIRG